jgi:hypothetical protein
MGKNTSFDQFTNQYSLSKTLRFELKPMGNTQQMLEDNNVFGKDKNIQKKYEQTKPFFDRLHREFVKESLSNAKIDGLKEYFEIWKEWQGDKKDKNKKKKLENKEKELRKNIVQLFDATAEKWLEGKYSNVQMKKNDKGFLFEENVFALLKERYGKEEKAFLIDEKGSFVLDEEKEKISLFSDWKGFVGYFGKFFETRKNFYKDEGKAGQIATRIINQNLRRFCSNILDFQKVEKKVNFIEVENSFEIQISELFSVEYYNNCLEQEGIDRYNSILGADSKVQGKEGINQYINKYRQIHKGEKLSFLKALDKQILSEKDKFIDEIENDEELKVLLIEFRENSKNKINTFRELFDNFIENNEECDLSKIYFSKFGLEKLIYRWVSEGQLFEESLFSVLNDKEIKSWYEARKQKGDSSIKKDKDFDNYSFPKFVQLKHIKDALQNISEDTKLWKERYYEQDKKDSLLESKSFWEQFLFIFSKEFSQLYERKYIDPKTKVEKVIGYDSFTVELDNLLKDFKIDVNSKPIIKDFADDVLHICQMAKYFAVEKKLGWVSDYELDVFYTEPDTGYLAFHDNSYIEIVQVYNKIRNYLTKKSYSEDKWKLNFDNPALANGWDKNKEDENTTILLRKEGKYYLGLMKKKCNKIFQEKNNLQFKIGLENGKYEKVVYKFSKDVSLGIPKSSTQVVNVINHFYNNSSDFFLEKGSRVGKFKSPLKITKEIFELNNRIYKKNELLQSVLRKEITKDDEKEYIKLFQKEYVKLGGDKNIFINSVHKWIDFCKDFLSVYPSSQFFDYSSLKSTTKYSSLDEFYSDVNDLSYKISFQDISEQYINDKNNQGELYLFQIKNKDWNDGSTGTKNLQTLYFESLFSEENIAKNFPMKLNGQAEIFYRPKTDVAKLGMKTDKKGKSVINHKRYSENKIFFHVPITLNRIAGDTFKFNTQVNDFLANNSDINIIGIDRGEKHLAYYSVIDQKGKILKDKEGRLVEGSLNFVGKDANGEKIDYHEKLEKIANDREQSRKDWGIIEGIKNMKKGYISQVVHTIVNLAIEHNAIIVLEDLNMRFKQIRGGIEKSVYQQLEKALIDKLSFLVRKGEKDSEKAGNLLKAYQLSAPFESFQKMGKQTGIMFYTQASYTSKTCPNCGFRPNIRFKYNTIEKAQLLLEKLDSFKYNQNKNSFELSYSLSNIWKDIGKNKKKRENMLYEKDVKKNTFSISSEKALRHKWRNKHINKKSLRKGEKIHSGTDTGIILVYNITECLEALFERYNIDYKSNDLQKIISQNYLDSKFYRDLFYYLSLLMNTRDSISGDDSENADKIVCPSCSFDSKNGFQGQKFNGDANGAYNVARKGNIILEKITQYYNDNDNDCDKLSYAGLFIDMDEWDKFTQK